MIPLVHRNRIGPGVRNPLKNVRGRWSTSTVFHRNRFDALQGETPVTVRTFTSVATPHVTAMRDPWGSREVARRLHQSERNAA